ncbi:MAG: hypothetical protein AAB565_00290, partial [Patescibacteria group bacterium]
MAKLPRQLLVVALLSFLVMPVLVGAVEIKNPLKADTFEKLILNIVNFIFTLALPIVVIMIIVGGFMFVTAAGEPAKIQQGKQLILWAVIGLIVILLAKGMITLIKEIFIR